MNLKSSFLFAKRILFPKSGRATIGRKSLAGAVLCVGVSLIPMVVVLAVSNGMIEGITKRLVSLSSSHIQAFSADGDARSLQAAAQKIAALDGISASYPMIESSALAMANSKRCGVTLRALPPEVFEGLASYKELFEAESGDIKKFSVEQKGVLIGKGVAEKLELSVGDKIRVVTVKKGGAGKLSPSARYYKVSAVVSCGYRELDALWLFLPFDEGAKITRDCELSASVMCEIEKPFSPQISVMQKSVKDALGKGFKVYRWDQMNKSQYENFSSTKILLLFIQLLIVLASSVNISSALGMLALERRREIAILKSLGGSSKGVSLSFLITGFACGLGGLLIGMPIGLFLSVNINGLLKTAEKAVNFVARGLCFFANGDIMAYRQIHLLSEEYYLKVIPIDVPFGDLLLIGAAALLLSLAASAVPAIKAGRARPLDTLRDSR